MRRWTLWLPLLALMLLGGMAIYGLSVPKDPFVHSKMVGQKLPAFNMPAAVEGVPPLSSTDFADGKPRLLDFGVTDEQAWDVGLACGGKVQVFVEKVG